MIEELLARLLIPLVALLVLSAAGIAVLIVEHMREGREDAPAPSRQPTAPPRAAAASRGKSEPHDTVLVRNVGRDSAPPPPRGRTATEPARPAPARPGPRPSMDAPTVPVLPTRRSREMRLQQIGSNILVNAPVDPGDYVQLPGRLEVIYGNFSPNDPREILLFRPPQEDGVPRYRFSKTAGDGVFHIQLNHYTVTPLVQAELTYVDGRHVLVNTVPEDEMDRYQTRINGVPMAVAESQPLSSGDIISMGIFRLKLTL